MEATNANSSQYHIDAKQLEDSIAKAKQLFPKDDPLTKIFMYVDKNKLCFEVKEKGLFSKTKSVSRQFASRKNTVKTSKEDLTQAISGLQGEKHLILRIAQIVDHILPKPGPFGSILPHKIAEQHATMNFAIDISLKESRTKLIRNEIEAVTSILNAPIDPKTQQSPHTSQLRVTALSQLREHLRANRTQYDQDPKANALILTQIQQLRSLVDQHNTIAQDLFDDVHDLYKTSTNHALHDITKAMQPVDLNTIRESEAKKIPNTSIWWSEQVSIYQDILSSIQMKDNETYSEYERRIIDSLHLHQKSLTTLETTLQIIKDIEQNDSVPAMAKSSYILQRMKQQLTDRISHVKNHTSAAKAISDKLSTVSVSKSNSMSPSEIESLKYTINELVRYLEEIPLPSLENNSPASREEIVGLLDPAKPPLVREVIINALKELKKNKIAENILLNLDYYQKRQSKNLTKQKFQDPQSLSL